MKFFLTAIFVLCINSYANAQFVLPSFQALNTSKNYVFSDVPIGIDEGAQYTIKMVSSNIVGGTKLYWTINHITTSTADFIAESGSFFISNNTGSFIVATANDDIVDPETFTISLRKTSISGEIITTSAIINSNDLTEVAEFDLMNAPNNTSLWNDPVSGLTATIVKSDPSTGNWGTTASFGGGLVFDDTHKGYIEIPGLNKKTSSFTISIAGDFNPNISSHNNPFFDGSALTTASNNIWANFPPTNSAATTNPSNTTELIAGFKTFSIIANPSQIKNSITNTEGVSWYDFVFNGASITAYKNGNIIISGMLNNPNIGWGSKLRFGSEYNQVSNTMNGTWYRMKYSKQALDQAAITAQFNSIRSTYNGLTGSIQFNGTNQYLETPSGGVNILPLANFTWEAFVYPTMSTGQQTFISNIQGTEGLYFGTQNNTLTPIYNEIGSTTAIMTSSESLILNQWNHVALVRKGGVMAIYVNGKLGVSASINRAFQHQTIRFGGQGARYFKGYMSNIRLVSSETDVNAAVYSGTSFTVPTSPLVKIANTQVLLNTINGSGFLSEVSTNGYTIINYNSATSSSLNPFNL